MHTTPAHWFLRGSMVGILICAALNAGSYFARSTYWGILFGAASRGGGAMGFPLLMWEEGNNYDGYFVDVRALTANLALGLMVGTVGGAMTLVWRRPLNAFEQRVLSSLPPQRAGRFQFSLRGLLFAMALAALVAAGARYALAGHVQVLGMIYLFGPWVLVATAFVPLGLRWEQRVYLIIPVTMLLMLAAVGVGRWLQPPLEFDAVLLGIFVFWTPQTVLAALAIGTVLAVRLIFAKETQPSDSTSPP